MWIEKTATGKFKYSERYADPMTGKLKKVSVTLDSNKKASQKAAEEALRRRVEILTAPSDKYSTITFGALCDAYTSSQRGIKEQTVVGNRKHCKKLRELIGEQTLVAKLTAPYVRSSLWSDSPATYNERLARFKALMRWAYREELAQNISYLEKLPKVKSQSVKEKDKDKYLEKDELIKLLDAMKVDSWKLLTRFLALSGLRIGEAIALNEDDIDFQAREIRVNKTYSLVTRKISTTKTETSTRSVAMQDELHDCCLEIIKRKWKIANITGKSSGLFFPDANDCSYIHYETYEKYFRENTEAILGRRLTVHSLRHTHVALLAENGIPLDVISRRLGHAHSGVTRDVYFHVTKKLAEKDANLIKAVKII